MLPLIQQLVIDKEWLDEDEAVDCIAISQALPGILAINAATYVGKKKCGIAGAVAATLGSIAPSFLIIIAVVTLLGTVSENPVVEGAFLGVKAAVCGLVLVAAVRHGKRILKDAFTWILAVITLVLIIVLDMNALWAIIGGGAAGIIYQTLWKGRTTI